MRRALWVELRRGPDLEWLLLTMALVAMFWTWPMLFG